MITATTDGSGAFSDTHPLVPGARYIFAFVFYNAPFAGGSVLLRELTPAPWEIDFYAEIGGTAPVSWDLTAVPSGRMEFTATCRTALLTITGADAAEQFEYAIIPVSR